MTMNQIPMGPPPGGMPNIVKPIADGIDSMFKGAQDRRRDMAYLAANHALTSVRNERQHGYSKDLQGMKQRHESGMQRRDLAVRQAMQTEKLQTGSRDAAGQQRFEMRKLRTSHAQGMERLGSEQNHELNTSALSSANTVAELRAKTRAVNSIGKRGRVSEFKVGDIQAKFNPYTEAAPAQNQSPAPAAPEAPQATAASTAPAQTAGAFIPKVVQGPGGKIMKNPDHPDNKGMAPAPVAKKAGAKRATAKKSAPRPRKK